MFAIRPSSTTGARPSSRDSYRIVSSASDRHVVPPSELESRIRAGDVRAFEELFRGSYQSLCRFAYRYLFDTGLAEDLVQDLFASLWADRARLELRGSVRAYLFAAVRNRALNVRKRRLVERDWAQDEALPQVRRLHRAPASSDQALDTKERDGELNAAIESLPERCRMVMRLRWQEQMSHAEIAAVMGISLKGVEQQLARGLATLRQRFCDAMR